jgi:hypothetical protein
MFENHQPNYTVDAYYFISCIRLAAELDQFLGRPLKGHHQAASHLQAAVYPHKALRGTFWKGSVTAAQGASSFELHK